jgi:hydroxyacylglutathione hydrolase
MLIKTLPVGYLETNCYVVTSEDDLSCAVIDPGAEAGLILNYLEEHHLTCSAILVTHGHFDHVTALPAVREETGAPVYVGRGDVNTDLGSNRRFVPPEGSELVGEGDVIEAGSLRFEVLETPGHSPGSLCFKSGHCLFTGDTLFHGSCGRTDFIGGSMPDMMVSLRRLAALPGDYEVYPGHEESSTLESERRYNPYVREAMRG